MALHLFQNLYGTLKSSFSIGKNGVTIHQGINDPNVSEFIGKEGDLYVKHGEFGSGLYQQKDNRWTVIGLDQELNRSVITTSGRPLNINEHYVGVNYDGAVNIALPEGVTGKQFIIKDESGIASEENSITVHAFLNETIDGQPDITITKPYQVIRLMFDGGWHVI